MKITKTLNTLNIVLYPLMLRVGGILFLLIGGFIVYSSFSTKVHAMAWLTLIFPLVGICLLFAGKVILEFNKEQRTLQITTASLFNTSKSEYQLSNIQTVFIEEAYVAQSEQYKVILQMKDKQNIPLTYFYDPLLSHSIQLAKEIIIFLNLNQDLSKWEHKSSHKFQLALGFFILGFIITVMLIIFK